MHHQDSKRLRVLSLCILTYACVWSIRGSAEARDISSAASTMLGACFGKACVMINVPVQHKGVQADLVTRADAAAAAGLAHRCGFSGERDTGDKWAPLAPHD